MCAFLNDNENATIVKIRLRLTLDLWGIFAFQGETNGKKQSNSVVCSVNFRFSMQIVCYCNLHLNNKQTKKKIREKVNERERKGARVQNRTEKSSHIAVKEQWKRYHCINSIQSLHHFNLNSIASESIPSVCCRLIFYVAHQTSKIHAHTFSIVIYICLLACFFPFNINVKLRQNGEDPTFRLYSLYFKVGDREKRYRAPDCKEDNDFLKRHHDYCNDLRYSVI